MSAARPSVSIWKRLLLLIAGVCILAVLVFGYSAFTIWRRIPESYAAWTTGDLMVEYLREHTNQWPRGWDDLKSATNSLMERGRPVYWPLGALPQLVKIDWQADVKELQRLAWRDSNAQ